VEFGGFILGLSSYRGTTLWTGIETARKFLPYSRLSSRIPICLLIVHPHFGSVFGVYIHRRSPSVSES
jgi:hypothetical protein